MALIALRPNGDTATKEFSRSTGTNNYALVADDVETTWVYGSNKTDIYTLANLSLSGDPVIQKIRFPGCCSNDAYLILYLKISGSLYEVPFNRTNNFIGTNAYFYGDRSTNPHTGVAWTKQDIDDLEIGYKAVTQTPAAKVFWTGITVYYNYAHELNVSDEFTLADNLEDLDFNKRLAENFTLTDEITFGGAGKGTQYFRTFSDVFTLNDASSIDATLNLYKIVIGYDRKMIMNSSQQLTAIGYYNYEEDRDLTREVTWRSSNPSVATIDADGLLSSYSYGITFITATLGLMSTTAMLQNEDVTATLPVISSLQQIPIDSSPNQTFSTTLKVDGKNITLGFFLRWNEQAGYWAMTIYNYLTGRYYVDSLPLLKGTLPSINLLQMYSYLRIGSCYLINISGSKDDYPTVSNLGKDFLLLWGDTEV